MDATPLPVYLYYTTTGGEAPDLIWEIKWQSQQPS